MKIILSIFSSFLLLVMLSCHEVKKADMTVPIENINFFSLEKKELSELFVQNSKNYILLKSDNDDLLLGRIDKAMIQLGRIYLMDKRMKRLVVYDKIGNGIGKVGVFGQGPKEYLNISDFDVDKYGNIYVLDGRLNKIFIYNTSFDCIKEKKLPFDADVLSVLHGDTIIYGLSSWNTKGAEGSKLAMVDKEEKIIGQFFEYTKDFDPSFWISNYLLGRSKEYISYNQTINNDVSVFSQKGELMKIFRFDFGRENVPEEDKVDIERKLANFDNYTMLRKILSVTDRYIIGFIWEHRQTKMFIVDYESKSCYFGDILSDMDRRLGCGLSDEAIISYIDSESEIYPDSVNDHVKMGNFVLQIQSIK